MLNKDINSRFADWLLSPTEALDFEVKQWLDINELESRGAIAKALIALENHGGGFLLIGYKEDELKRLVPDENRPVNLQIYGTDAINSILKKCAEPVFHAEVTFQKHPESGEEFPLIRVMGNSRVPVRSSSATPGKTLHQNIYYIRRPGPESHSPQNGAEWDRLLHRCILAHRDEIMTTLRAFLPGGLDGGGTPSDELAELQKFKKAAFDRWSELNGGLPAEHQARISYGHFIFSARIIGKSLNTSLKDILSSIHTARRYTGWPAFVAAHDDAIKPKHVDGCMEAWLALSKYPDSGHADFWRIDPKGNFFLLRGMQEDTLDGQKPGTLFDITLPVWRLGEFLLRVTELGELMYEEGFEVVIECEWNGLKGRTLTVVNGRRHVGGQHVAEQNNVQTHEQYSQQVIRDLLPNVVKSLVSPVFEVFDFFQPVDSLYSDELNEMTKGNM